MSKGISDNSRLFADGMRKASSLINDHLYAMLLDVAADYLSDMVRNKEYQGFTGNTQTSYSCGLYVNGKLADVIVQRAFGRNPIRLKVRKDERAFLKNPYEGKSRAVRGRVDVDSLYGAESAFDFLKSYKDIPRKGFAVVATTGTEYSEYLENVRHLNVMTGTWQSAKSIFESHLKPMKE